MKLSKFSVLFAAVEAMVAAASIDLAGGYQQHSEVENCIDNNVFFIDGNPLHDCQWLQKKKSRRNNHCQVKEVRMNCPLVCGSCCEDRTDFQFQIGDEDQVENEGDSNLKNCAWLVKNSKAHCHGEYQGINVANACPKACNKCNDPVPFEDIGSLIWSPNGQTRKKKDYVGKPSKKKGNKLHEYLKEDISMQRVLQVKNPGTKGNGLKKKVRCNFDPAPLEEGTTRQRALQFGKGNNLVKKKITSPPVGTAAPTLAPVLVTLTPTVSAGTPTVGTVFPTVSGGTPTEGTVTPTVSEGTPTVGTVTPTVSEGTPTVGTVTPTVSGGTPTVGTVTPTVSGGTPTVGTGGPVVDTTGPTGSPVVSTGEPTASTGIPTAPSNGSPGPVVLPSCAPSSEPSRVGTIPLSNEPSLVPSNSPIREFSDNPSIFPSLSPSSYPSHLPSGQPSRDPSSSPSQSPSSDPSSHPSENPSIAPSTESTQFPSVGPTDTPSGSPSHLPSNEPTQLPTSYPTASPTVHPSVPPSTEPSQSPSEEATNVPSEVPSPAPSFRPSENRRSEPSNLPSPAPTFRPSENRRTSTTEPSGQPTFNRRSTSMPTGDNLGGDGNNTVSPTASPTECEDDPTYISPIVLRVGCEMYNLLNCTCGTFSNFMTAEQLQELFTKCPKTCGVPCDYQVTAPTISPAPSSTPTINRNPRPGSNTALPSVMPTEFGQGSGGSTLSPTLSTLQPTGCYNDETYTSPLAAGFGCNFHDLSLIDCNAWFEIGFFNATELQEVLTRCPESCDLPCASRPSSTPSQTLSQFPSYAIGCDDTTYVSPMNSEYGCNFHRLSLIGCNQWFDLGFLDEEELQELFDRCPDACGIPCSPSAQPSKTSSRRPSLLPTRTPSSTPSTQRSGTSLPSFAPSEKATGFPSIFPSSSFGCDDETYVSPMNSAYDCLFHRVSRINCNSFYYLGFLNATQHEELLERCPQSCGLPCPSER